MPTRPPKIEDVPKVMEGVVADLLSVRQQFADDPSKIEWDTMDSIRQRTRAVTRLIETAMADLNSQINMLDEQSSIVEEIDGWIRDVCEVFKIRKPKAPAKKTTARKRS